MADLSLKEQLENRMLLFSKNIHDIIQQLPKDKVTLEYCDQLNRSSCSVGANYIEVNEAESRKDFFHRLKICRKESKESRYWLYLIQHSFPGLNDKIEPLVKESTEFVRILSASLRSQNI